MRIAGAGEADEGRIYCSEQWKGFFLCGKRGEVGQVWEKALLEDVAETGLCEEVGGREGEEEGEELGAFCLKGWGGVVDER